MRNTDKLIKASLINQLVGAGVFRWTPGGTWKSPSLPPISRTTHRYEITIRKGTIGLSAYKPLSRLSKLLMSSIGHENPEMVYCVHKSISCYKHGSLRKP